MKNSLIAIILLVIIFGIGFFTGRCTEEPDTQIDTTYVQLPPVVVTDTTYIELPAEIVVITDTLHLKEPFHHIASVKHNNIDSISFGYSTLDYRIETEIEYRTDSLKFNIQQNTNFTLNRYQQVVTMPTPKLPDYIFSAGIVTDFEDNSIEVGMSRRIIDRFYFGFSFSTQNVGVGISYVF